MNNTYKKIPAGNKIKAFEDHKISEKLHHGAKKNDRNAIINTLKKAIETRNICAEQNLNKHKNGSLCATQIAQNTDQIMSDLCDAVQQHIFKTSINKNQTPCIIATGGYGYGMMAPQSDIDIVFLIPADQNTPQPFIEFILYMLWDTGLHVGHAIRTPEQCLEDIENDHTINTAFLNVRKIWGPDTLFNALNQKLQHWHQKQTQKDIRNFIKAKLDERDQRHHTHAISRYLTEPDVKNGKGGLRDLNTLYWISLFIQKKQPQQETQSKKNTTPHIWKHILTKKEIHTLKTCESMLWATRCHLHFICKRDNNRLSFDYQEDMARRFGYPKKNTRNPNTHIEKFMKQYFLTAKDVGDLTRIFCAVLEIRNIKELPQQKQQHTLQNTRNNQDFIYERGRVSFKNRNTCRHNPSALISLFRQGETMPIHPDALKQATRNLHLIDETLRRDTHANAHFIDILVPSDGVETNPENSLRRMNEAGILGQFIPEFGAIIAHMQFDMYHHYTVDEHLFQTVGFIRKIEQGMLNKHHPLCSRIVHKIKNRRALYVAAFLHDVAKGGKEHHAIAGEKITKKLSPRFGLDKEETQIAAWLVRNHLLMSETSQKRDIRDPETITQFCATVETVELLRLLIILTVADIRAVGPKVWAGWMGHLLRDLYFLAKEHLETQRMGHPPQTAQKHAAKHAWEAFTKAQKNRTVIELQNYKKRHHETYWTSHTLGQQNTHFKLIETAEKNHTKTTKTHLTFRERKAVNMDEYTLYTDDHPYLLAALIGACIAEGMSIIGAKIYTTKDGKALDTLYVKNAFGKNQDNADRHRAYRLSERLKQAAEGTISNQEITRMIEERQKHNPPTTIFPIQTTVTIDNDTTPYKTIIEIAGLNDSRALFSCVQTLSDLNLNIESAHLRILGIRRECVFYTTHLNGKKLTSQHHIKKAKQCLLNAVTADTTPNFPLKPKRNPISTQETQPL